MAFFVCVYEYILSQTCAKLNIESCEKKAQFSRRKRKRKKKLMRKKIISNDEIDDED